MKTVVFRTPHCILQSQKLSQLAKLERALASKEFTFYFFQEVSRKLMYENPFAWLLGPFREKAKAETLP
jgi:hypothetical protein